MAKSETGTQLLARLGARPSLSGLESALFGSEPVSGSVYEFYGGEGTGKTEMTLHLTAKCILPESWHDVPLGGKDTGVIVVDTEYKFPVFRLAVILEHRIKAAMEKSSIVASAAAKEETKSKSFGCTENGNTNLGQNVDAFSEEDIERFIQNCLRNLHILQCGSSFQFLMSMCSLESLISNNPNISMIVIDTISAYYWVEKCQVPDGQQAMDSVMKPIISVLSDYVRDYNTVVLCVKSALCVHRSSQKSGQRSKGDNSPHPDSSVQSASSLSRELNASDHFEFLGKLWNKFVTKRFTFTQSAVSTGQDFSVTASKEGQTTKVKFKIFDSGIYFIP
ncbi:DNA repair protein XRCC2-like [Liolophura sinensis]|uniref:DNA repair protein XRCC2-like n=1 Tax=Liolophura sinensis TaxID=3198878 RepID=UPI003158144F